MVFVPQGECNVAYEFNVYSRSKVKLTDFCTLVYFIAFSFKICQVQRLHFDALYLCFCVGYHGNTGPLVVSDVKPTSLSDAFVQAGVELGLKSLDVNGESQEGLCAHRHKWQETGTKTLW